MTEEIIIDCAFYKDGVCASPINKTCEYCKNIDVSKCYHKQLKRLEQENKELKEQHYEALKMLKHEYNGRQRDNEQWFTRCTENHNEDSKIIEKYRSALEEINLILDELKQQYDYMTDYSEIKEIQDKITEVLQ